MAKFSFGNAADYSTLFGNLYSSTIAKQQAQSVADQNAMDSDMYSQWQQGMISDSDWLNYIGQRVQATASDTTSTGVKNHEHWVTMQREYTNSIADNQAKANYQAGGSINDYIAYLQGRMTGLNPNNQEYRNVANELMSMQDTRAQSDLSTGAQSIIDDIQAGKKSYKDLLKFYQQGLSTVRSGNTTLYKDVQSKIEQTENQIKSDTVSAAFGKLQYQYDGGQLTGSQVAAQLRSLANTYYKNDPTKYYATLDQAIKMDKVGSAYIGAKKGSGRGSGSLSGGTKSAIDASKANLKVFTEAGKLFANGAPAVVIGGKTYTAQSLFHDYAKSADALSGTYRSNGKLADAAQVQNNKSYFIRTYMQKANTISDTAKIQALVVSASTQLEAALANPDPLQALNVANRLGKEWSSFAQSLQQKVTDLPRDNFAGATTPVPAQDQMTPAANNEVAAFGALLTYLSSPQTTRQDALDFIQKAAIGKLIPSTVVHEIVDKLAGPETQPSNKLLGAGPQAAALYGTNSGGVQQADLIATPDGIQVIPRSSGMVRDPQTGQLSVGGVPDFTGVVGKGDKTTKVLIDVNGKPMLITAILAPYKSSAFLQYTNTSGRQLVLSDGSKVNNGGAIPSSALNDPVVKAAIDGQGITKQPANMGLYATMIPAYTDSTGKSYSAQAYIYDPKTRTYYQSLPLQYVAMNNDGSGTVQVDKSGHVVPPDYKSFATAAGVPIPYSGAQDQTVQNMWNSGALANDVPQPGTRGPGGQVTPDAHDYSTAYFDPSQNGAPEAVSNSQQSSQAYDNYVAPPAKVKIDKAKKAWSDSALNMGSDSVPPTPNMDGGLSQVSQLAAGAGLKVGSFGTSAAFPATNPAHALPQISSVPLPPPPTFNTPTQAPGSALPTVQLPPVAGIPQFQGDMPGESSPAQAQPLSPTVKVNVPLASTPATHAPGHGALEY